MNKLPSHHWFVLFLSLFIPAMGLLLHTTLFMTESYTTAEHAWNNFTAFYMTIALWWIFAIITGIRPEYQQYNRDEPRYVKWLLILPVTVLAYNFAFDYWEQYDERIVWFNSVVVTWIGMLCWICVDWYRWKFNPNARQQRVIARTNYRAKRQAEIDKIPNCVVPSGLKLITE